LCQGSEREVIRGSVEDCKFSVFYMRGDRIIAIDSVNASGDHIVGRKLLGHEHSVSDDQIRDTGFNLRSLMM